MKNLKKWTFLAALGLLLVSGGCRIRYTLSGASIPADIETVSIDLFENNAPIVIPSLAQDFTERLRDKFLSRSSLRLIQSGGDLYFQGTITRYEVKPLALQGDNQAAQNRLTISMSVSLTCEKHNELAWETPRTFSQFADFDAGTDLAAVQDLLIEEINDKLVQDIFNKAFGNW